VTATTGTARVGERQNQQDVGNKYDAQGGKTGDVVSGPSSGNPTRERIDSVHEPRVGYQGAPTLTESYPTGGVQSGSQALNISRNTSRLPQTHIGHPGTSAPNVYGQGTNSYQQISYTTSPQQNQRDRLPFPYTPAAQAAQAPQWPSDHRQGIASSSDEPSSHGYWLEPATKEYTAKILEDSAGKTKKHADSFRNVQKNNERKFFCLGRVRYIFD
jgi:hypothetical protein